MVHFQIFPAFGLMSLTLDERPGVPGGPGGPGGPDALAVSR